MSTRSLRGPRWTAATAILILAGCASASPSATEVDFFAEVVAVDAADEWTVTAEPGSATAFSTGGEESPLTVGPAVLRTVDGAEIEIPPRTRGGNLCSLLGYRDQPRVPTCLVAGVLDSNGAAEWFSVGPLDRGDDGLFSLTVDRFEGRDAIVLVGGTSIALPVPPDALLRCSASGDLAATPMEIPAQDALVSLDRDLNIAAVECLYAE